VSLLRQRVTELQGCKRRIGLTPGPQGPALEGIGYTIVPMMRCPACSAQSVEGGRYCSECGALLRDRTSAATETSAEGASAVVSHASVDRARFIPGTVLSKRYRIVSLLGRGGMGEVYRADDLKLGQPVALKFLTEPVARDEARLARFLNESRSPSR